MLPGPLSVSPPETDQVTPAAPPLERVAVNCSTDAPCELAILQPVQLVSMAPVPGEMEKLAFEGFADTPPPPHPAINSSAGAKSIDKFRKYRLRMVYALVSIGRRLHPRIEEKHAGCRVPRISSAAADETWEMNLRSITGSSPARSSRCRRSSRGWPGRRRTCRCGLRSGSTCGSIPPGSRRPG